MDTDEVNRFLAGDFAELVVVFSLGGKYLVVKIFSFCFALVIPRSEEWFVRFDCKFIVLQRCKLYQYAQFTGNFSLSYS